MAITGARIRIDLNAFWNKTCVQCGKPRLECVRINTLPSPKGAANVR